MISARRRWSAAALVLGLGWLVTPGPVPVYDGIGQPDEPYRYVVLPQGATPTKPATEARGQSPVKDGLSTNGLSIKSKEVGPQVSMFIPLAAMAAQGGTVQVAAVPAAPADQPRDATIDGNVYLVTISDGVGAVTFTDKAALAVIYLRATTADQPGPVMFHRDAADEKWAPLKTSRGGMDFYISNLTGPGEYALAFLSTPAESAFPVLPAVLLGGVVLVAAVVLTIRLRAPSSSEVSPP